MAAIFLTCWPLRTSPSTVRNRMGETGYACSVTALLKVTAALVAIRKLLIASHGWPPSGAPVATRSAVCLDPIPLSYAGVCLPDATRAQGAWRQGDSRRRHLGVPSGSQDRRGRAERRRQVDTAEDDGRARAAVQRRSSADARFQRRNPRAGAAAERTQDGPWQRRGRRRRDQGSAGSVQRDRGKARR